LSEPMFLCIYYNEPTDLGYNILEPKDGINLTFVVLYAILNIG